MADDVDIANQVAEEMIRESIANRKQEKKLPRIGVCHNCGEPVSEKQLFCDNYCAEDYEKLGARK
jgi:hypothetical protein